jgi:two-component system, OmpR family, response regulator
VTHVLLAIDDATLCDSANEYLSRQGYLTSTTTTREAVDRVCQDEGADVLILDALGCAEETCSALRCVSAIPLIVLTSRDDSEERARGLDAGADDYLVKPFNPRELMARIRVVVRRASFESAGSAQAQPHAYYFGDWCLEVPSRTLRHADGSAHALTGSEFRLLEALVTHPRELLPFDRSIAPRMSRMRQILRDRKMIRCLYGAGYLFESDVVTDYLLLAPGREASWLVR